jgi:hypothetical protein
MSRLKVFIASSSEKNDVTNTVHLLLLQRLNQDVEVEPWTRVFTLSEVYIESLEKAVERADFAVMVLTPDDVINSRKTKKPAPRDNIVFELGLFMGRLGRERCYLVQEDQTDIKLKLPTDLLGVNSATFKRPNDGDLKVALDRGCALIAQRITDLGIRHKLSSETFAHHTFLRDFYARVGGVWWQRVIVRGGSALCFFQIELDEVSTSVRLSGRSYDTKGNCWGTWNSILARIIKEEKKLIYYWEGRHTLTPKERFHGLGEINFDWSGNPHPTISSGGGRFWDINETYPRKTVIKSVEIRRITDQKELSTMFVGKEKAVRSLVTKTLREW